VGHCSCSLAQPGGHGLEGAGSTGHTGKVRTPGLLYGHLTRNRAGGWAEWLRPLGQVMSQAPASVSPWATLSIATAIIFKWFARPPFSHWHGAAPGLGKT